MVLTAKILNDGLLRLVVLVVLMSAASAHAGTVDLDGLIEPYMVVDIGAPVAGIVAKVAVDRSSSVKKGEVLLALESSLERAALEKANAVASFDGDIKLQQTQLAFAERAHERVQALSMISDQDKDQAATEVELAKHRLKKAEENQKLGEIEQKKAQAALSLRSVSSPISGVVVERFVSPGEYVSSQPLLRVAQIDPLRVEVIVPSRMFGRITPGMKATIVPELSEYGDQTATVSLVDKVIDSASSTFGVRLELPNPEQKIPSGLKCTVKFDIDEAALGSAEMTDQTLLGLNHLRQP